MVMIRGGLSRTGDDCMRMLDDLYLPDGKRLTSQIVGKPGSGKSYYLTHTIDYSSD